MPFELFFITEGAGATTAVELQFDGQRLCIVRSASGDTPEIEFVQDLYVDRSVKMSFPLTQFLDTVQLAVDDLVAWQQNLAAGGAET